MIIYEWLKVAKSSNLSKSFYAIKLEHKSTAVIYEDRSSFVSEAFSVTCKTPLNQNIKTNQKPQNFENALAYPQSVCCIFFQIF